MDLITVDTPAGTMALAEEDGALTHIWLPGQGYPRMVQRETALLACAKAQLLSISRESAGSLTYPWPPKAPLFAERYGTPCSPSPTGRPGPTNR